METLAGDHLNPLSDAPEGDTTIMCATTPPVEPGIIVTTFGVLHGEAPHETRPVVKVDLTTALRNPADDPAMVYMTGLDAKVRDHVLSTPGAEDIIAAAAEQILATGRDAHFWCRGGRHRSVAAAEGTAARLRDYGLTVTVVHRDIDKPVVRKV